MLLNSIISSEKKQENSFLKLIHIGNLSYESESESHVFFCSFQPWLFPQNSPSNLPVVTRAVDLKLAGNLICGSIWVDSLKSRRLKYKDNSETQIFELGTDKINTVLLKDVINLAILTPESFWLTKGSTWVICIKLYEKNIIIPYFELLRVLFYQASSRLTKFFFSFLPINNLCRPIILPKEENSWYGAFYVSSTELSAQEARVLGGIIFDQALKNIFDLSQTHWLFPDSIDILAAKNDRITKLVGKLDISILFNANGRNFSHRDEQYFWVDSLEIINSHYSFNEVLFHPLQLTTLHSSDNSVLPLCSNLLNISKDATKSPKLHKCFDYRAAFHTIKHISIPLTDRTIERIKSLHSPFPYVICGLPWAVTPMRKTKTYWLDEALEKKITQPNKKLNKKHITCTNHLLDILTTFEKDNYNIEYLTLNNPNNIFGQGISVFPIHRHPPSPIHINMDNIATCTIASVELAYGKIFIIQPYPKDNPDLIILCQKQDLSVPKESEWNNLFNIITPMYSSKEFYNFFKLVKKLNIHNAPINSALLAIALPSKIVTKEFCISFSNHILSKFIKRLQFYVGSALKYPTGMTYNQQRDIIALSRNICKAPDYMWVTKIFSYWS